MPVQNRSVRVGSGFARDKPRVIPPVGVFQPIFDDQHGVIVKDDILFLSAGAFPRSSGFVIPDCQDLANRVNLVQSGGHNFIAACAREYNQSNQPADSNMSDL